MNTDIQRGNRRELTGRVVGDRMQKTIVVEVLRRVMHDQYKKYITLKKKFYAHDEKEEAKVGDIVLISESRPLSRLKRWRLRQVMKKGES